MTMDELKDNRHEGYMRLALQQAERALGNGEFPVGCVIVDDSGEVVGDGARRNSSVEFCELDHAEIVALRNLQQRLPAIDLARVTVYSTMEPCLMCYSTLIVNGVRKIVYGYEDVMGGGTKLELDRLPPLYAAVEMEVTAGVLRQESLQLFQRFFGSNDHVYLAGTLLAEYTLAQPGRDIT